MTALFAWLAGSRTALIAVVAALALSLATLGVQTLRLANEQRDHASDTAKYAQDREQIASQARKDTEAARIEGERRFTEQEKITNAAITQRDQKAADLAIATAAGSKLQDTANALARQLRAAAADTATAKLRTSTDTAATVLADVLSRLEQAGRAMAATATERGIAGTACERQYDSLMAVSVSPVI